MPKDSHAVHKEKGIEGLDDNVLYWIRRILVTEPHKLTTKMLASLSVQTRKWLLPCKNPSFQLPRMPLHLIAMLICAPKEVCPTVHIQHDPSSFIICPLPLMSIRPHLNPFGLQLTPWSSPLPPLLPTYFLYTMVP